MEYICQKCHKTFTDRKRGDRVIKYCSSICFGETRRGLPSWNKGVQCREETKEKLSKKLKGTRRSPKTEFKKGQKPHNFKGRFQNKDGYIMVYKPEHPHTTGRGYVLEHRLVAEKYLKRPLERKEVVHHINHICNDNRPENLYVFSNSALHLKSHKEKENLTSNIIIIKQSTKSHSYNDKRSH